jgi:hypothetical protein
MDAVPKGGGRLVTKPTALVEATTHTGEPFKGNGPRMIGEVYDAGSSLCRNNW